jgi:hypothetical protein
MKKLIAIALVLACGSVQASVNPGVVLTVGQWIIKNSNRVYYVQVEGHGSTETEARHNGFVLASEQAIGTVILSERESSKQQLVRNDVASYSSAYVDDFKILAKTMSNNEVVLKMDVWVAHSAIAKRLLNTSRTEGSIDGGRISAQVQTLQHERKSADRLLKMVLTDYPRRAFSVELEKTQVSVDANRTPQLEVAFHLSWNKQYLDGLAEAVTAINQRTDCGGFLGCRNVSSEIQVAGTRAWFNDNVAEQMMRTEMIQSGPAIRMTIVDTAGTEQFKQCFYAKELDHRDHATWHYVNVGYNKVTINGNASKRFNTFINLSKLPVANLDQVNLAVVRGSNC